MDSVTSSSGELRVGRSIGVLVAAIVVTMVGCLTGLISVVDAGASSGRLAEPGDSTVPSPTAAPTVAPTVAPTQPPVSETTPVPDETVAPPSSNWSSGGSSGGWSSSESGEPQRRSTVTYDAGEASSDTTTPPMTTTEDLLIGPSTTPAPSTTVAKRSLTGSSVTRTGGSSDPKIWGVVGALVFLAFALGIATWSYWRRTRPATAGKQPKGRGRKGRKSGRSRYADIVVTAPEP